MHVEEVQGKLILKGEVVTAGVMTRAGHVYPLDVLAQAARRTMDEVRGSGLYGTVGPMHAFPIALVTHITKYLSLDGLTLRARAEVLEESEIGRALATSLRKAMDHAKHGAFYRCEFRLMGIGALAADCIVQPDFRISAINITAPEPVPATKAGTRPSEAISVRDPVTGALL